MKLTNKALIFLGIGILVIILLTLGMLYTRQERKHDQLVNSMSTVQAVLPTLISESEELERELSQSENELIQAELLLNEARLRFPELVESIEYGEALFQITNSFHLVLTRFTASQPRAPSIEGATFLTSSFTVNLEGEEWNLETAGSYNNYVNQTVTHILEFVHELATNNYFAGTRVELVTINLPMPAPEGVDIEEEQYARPSASIHITIHSYPGE
jgi:hypothetical protein